MREGGVLGGPRNLQPVRLRGPPGPAIKKRPLLLHRALPGPNMVPMQRLSHHEA
jgi:hypothetical protein